jgi:hypothetical protein
MVNYKYFVIIFEINVNILKYVLTDYDLLVIMKLRVSRKRKDGEYMGKFAMYVNDGNLLAELARNRLTYQDMALLMGKRRAISFSDLLYGRVEPKITDMIAISKALGKPADYFFNFELRETSSSEEQKAAV